MLSVIENKIESLITMYTLTKEHENEERKKIVLSSDENNKNEIFFNFYVKRRFKSVLDLNRQNYNHLVCRIYREEDFSFTFQCSIGQYGVFVPLAAKLKDYKEHHVGYSCIKKEGRDYYDKTSYIINFIDADRFNDFFTEIVWENLMSI